jgi:hypothetical protein
MTAQAIDHPVLRSAWVAMERAAKLLSLDPRAQENEFRRIVKEDFIGAIRRGEVTADDVIDFASMIHGHFVAHLISTDEAGEMLRPCRQAEEAYKNGKANGHDRSPPRLLIPSGEFVRGFVPPDYCVDHLIMRGL